jgi:hypothetical protein
MRYGKAKRKQVDAESDPEDLKAAAARLDELLMPVRAPKEEKLALASRPEHLPGLVYCKHCDRPIKPEFAYAPTNPKSKVPLCKMLDCKSHRKPVEDSLLLNPDIDKAEAPRWVVGFTAGVFLTASPEAEKAWATTSLRISTRRRHSWAAAERQQLTTEVRNMTTTARSQRRDGKKRKVLFSRGRWKIYFELYFQQLNLSETGQNG